MMTNDLTNKDLAPVSKNQKNWTTSNFFTLWIGLSVQIPTYMMASSLIEGGMNWLQALVTIFLGNVIVLIPMILNGHVGVKYGIPYPVFARASFGIWAQTFRPCYEPSLPADGLAFKPGSAEQLFIPLYCGYGQMQPVFQAKWVTWALYHSFVL